MQYPARVWPKGAFVGLALAFLLSVLLAVVLYVDMRADRDPPVITAGDPRRGP